MRAIAYATCSSFASAILAALGIKLAKAGFKSFANAAWRHTVDRDPRAREFVREREGQSVHRALRRAVRTLPVIAGPSSGSGRDVHDAAVLRVDHERHHAASDVKQGREISCDVRMPLRR